MQVRFLPCKVNFPITSDNLILRKQEKITANLFTDKTSFRKNVREQIEETNYVAVEITEFRKNSVKLTFY